MPSNFVVNTTESVVAAETEHKVTMAVRRSDKLAIEEAWNDQHESSAHGLIGWQLNIQQVNKPTEEQQELQALSFIVKLMMNPFSLSEKERARL